jgi:hypothetical protein
MKVHVKEYDNEGNLELEYDVHFEQVFNLSAGGGDIHFEIEVVEEHEFGFDIRT